MSLVSFIGRWVLYHYHHLGSSEQFLFYIKIRQKAYRVPVLLPTSNTHTHTYTHTYISLLLTSCISPVHILQLKSQYYRLLLTKVQSLRRNSLFVLYSLLVLTNAQYPVSTISFTQKSFTALEISCVLPVPPSYHPCTLSNH